MSLVDLKLKMEEKAAFTLQSLYEAYGYNQYKMNKFEEYDLYVKNKDFLISDSIITFTDTNGKLMALKPDVTLSIVKKSQYEKGCVEKVYYNENVYRVSSGTKSFKEIMQVGIECIGDVDKYALCEVLLLAAKSLKALSDDCVLDVSHFGIVSRLIDSMGVSDSVRDEVLIAIGEKNLHELARICQGAGVGEEEIRLLTELVSLYGTPGKVLPKIRDLLADRVFEEELNLLEEVSSALADETCEDMLRIDFSVVSRTDYYNGIMFKGFLKGIPTSVLSGGQYDGLLRKMNSASSAIGFAVYLDLLEEMMSERRKYDVDTILLYQESASASLVRKAVESLQKEGKNVMAQKKCPKNIFYRELYELTEKGVLLIERNA